MTVPTENSKDTFVGDGFSVDLFVSFGARAASEFVVRKQVGAGAAVLLVAGVDYNVVSFSEVNADIQTVTPQTLSAIYTVERIVPLTQVVDLRTQGNFSPAVHEGIADESCYRDQQLSQRIKVLETAGNVGSVVAGDGLYFAATTLHVGAGAGIVVAPDSVAANLSNGNPNLLGTAQSPGVSNAISRADHVHQIQMATLPSALIAGGAAVLGSSLQPAHADHVHAIATAAPVNVTKAAASAGVANTFAASDHKHDATTAAAIDLTDAVNAEGVATTLARSDHTHQHGARGGGTLHALATPSVAGFLSPADKTKLDSFSIGASIGSWAQIQGTLAATAPASNAILGIGTFLQNPGGAIASAAFALTNLPVGKYQVSGRVQVGTGTTGTHQWNFQSRVNSVNSVTAYTQFHGTITTGFSAQVVPVIGGIMVIGSLTDIVDFILFNVAGSAGTLTGVAIIMLNYIGQ